MKDELKKPLVFKQIEFWVATIVYVFSIYVLAYNLFVHVSSGNTYMPNFDFFKEHNLQYSYLVNYTLPKFCIYTTYYGAFVFLNFLVEKTLANPRLILLNIILVIVVYILIALISSTANTWIKGYLFYDHTRAEVYDLIFNKEFVFGILLMVIYFSYATVKYIIKYMLSAYAGTNSGRANRECIVALVIWAVWYSLFAHRFSNDFPVMSSLVFLVGVAIYWYSFYALIPQILKNNGDFSTYLIKTIGILFASTVPVTLIGIASMPGYASSFGANIFTIGISLFFTVPFTWVIYQHRLARQQELTGLKSALGQSNADLDFLRSQINPHFLFNALNTLYGTAIQENAERTGEGIQKLGDMMRFMLQENNQDKILLTREVEYLQNYIDLQKLRTQLSPDILIHTEIDNSPRMLKIAPMMLIPFVENAFKHGISLRGPSHIKISLQTNNNKLIFDVSNSIHARPDNDPEKNRNGIGLQNVKQRLQFLYPDNHELIIHQNAREFFIHLSVTL